MLFTFYILITFVSTLHSKVQLNKTFYCISLKYLAVELCWEFFLAAAVYTKHFVRILSLPQQLAFLCLPARSLFFHCQKILLFCIIKENNAMVSENRAYLHSVALYE